MRVGLAAVLLGIPGTIVAVRALQSQLYDTAQFDAPTLTVGCFFLVCVSAFAAWIPARRITALDPREALSAE